MSKALRALPRDGRSSEKRGRDSDRFDDFGPASLARRASLARLGGNLA